MDFHYDSQCRRYLLQFMRIFSNIKVKHGPDVDGLYNISRVPIVYGDPSWVVAQLIKGASENTLMPVPMFSAYIDSIITAPERRQDTQFVSKLSTLEREFLKDENKYTSESGHRYDIERYMPVPYNIFFKLDCWTSNTDNKLQIWEQISTIFNPSIQLQQNNNILDWSSIFEVWLEDFTWTSRNIPQGGDMDRDVMSWKFKVPIWINPPAKVKRSTLIHEIITSVFTNVDIKAISDSVDNRDYDVFRTILDSIPTQIITTEGNYKISVARNGINEEITLLNEFGQSDKSLSWKSLIDKYGKVEPGITKIRLRLSPNVESDEFDVIGSFSLDPLRPNIIIFTPDGATLPINTIHPILNIIDPVEVMPGNGLPNAVVGHRYLLTSSVSLDGEPVIPPGVNMSPWGSGLVAYPNDVIEYDGNNWVVIFNSRNAIGKNYVLNLENNTQYVFDGADWFYSYYGEYSPGYWIIDNVISVQKDSIID